MTGDMIEYTIVRKGEKYGRRLSLNDFGDDLTFAANVVAETLRQQAQAIEQNEVKR